MNNGKFISGDIINLIINHFYNQNKQKEQIKTILKNRIILYFNNKNEHYFKWKCDLKNCNTPHNFLDRSFHKYEIYEMSEIFCIYKGERSRFEGNGYLPEKYFYTSGLNSEYGFKND